jgi:hypothetical protein
MSGLPAGSYRSVPYLQFLTGAVGKPRSLLARRLSGELSRQPWSLKVFALREVKVRSIALESYGVAGA